MNPRAVDRCLDALCGLVLPPRCVLCGREGQRPCLDLCAACEAALPAPAHPLCCDVPPLDRRYAPFAYGYPMDHLLQSLKYRGQLAVGRVLGSLLAEQARLLGVHLDVDCLVPVPLHPARHADRGYNQTIEIARWAGRSLCVPVTAGATRRTRDTRAQVRLRPDERRANLVGAFVADRQLRGRRVVIVDDVYTTGSTVAALALAIREAGAVTVDAWCCAMAAAPVQVHLLSSMEAADA